MFFHQSQTYFIFSKNIEQFSSFRYSSYNTEMSIAAEHLPLPRRDDK
jgi:hypothetical protein